ncbi:MAG: twin-arginine translocase subunit TatC [Bdellovibrionales bacterium]|nr:twin-arginine translocase subunit TatC [Bdellovibrionales bacterium]
MPSDQPDSMDALKAAQNPDTETAPKALNNPNSEEELRMPLWQHLDELRSAIIRVLLVLGVLVAVLFNYSEHVIVLLEKPLLDVLPEGNRQLYFTGIADKFMIYIKVSIIAALAVGSPYILFEVWRFVAPALYKHERRLVLPFMLFGTLSFVGGIVFAYYIVMPYSYDFLINFGSSTDQAIITLTEYFGMTTKLLLALGLVFELPACMILLALLGVLEAGVLEKYRRYAVLGISILAAVITPSPDALTMLIVMVPLYLLYEISIIGVRLVSKTSPE